MTAYPASSNVPHQQRYRRDTRQIQYFLEVYNILDGDTDIKHLTTINYSCFKLPFNQCSPKTETDANKGKGN